MLSWRRICLMATMVALLPVAQAQYSTVNLTSDGSIEAFNTDPNLVNPWGLAFSPTGPFWINDNGTTLSTVYDSFGAPYPSGEPLMVNVPPIEESRPTGIVYNPSSGFIVTSEGGGGGASAGRGQFGAGPSVFIFVTEDGVISGWNPNVDATNAIPVVDNVVPGSNYKGCALGVNNGRTYLYATNFSEGAIDAFDSNWRHAGSFTDPYAPRNYAPFGITNINGQLFVSYAMVDSDRVDDVPGLGHGFIDIFTPGGRFVRRLFTGGHLNSPWGMTLAPNSFYEFRTRLLVGNFGDGQVNVFEPVSGRFIGTMMESSRNPVTIPGLWALVIGNGGLGGDRDKVYFTAGPNGESGGLFGYIGRGIRQMGGD